MRVEASRRSICCPYDALPASAPSVSTPPPRSYRCRYHCHHHTTITTTSIAHRDTVVVSRLPISRPPLVLTRLLVHPLTRRLLWNPPSSYPAARDPAVSFPLPLILPRFRYEASSLRIRRRPSRALPLSRSSLFVALSSFPIILSSVFVFFHTVALILQS